ncbi:hypothetical protein JNUCC64_25480 [Streptomyces sp. JNUCC 64]
MRQHTTTRRTVALVGATAALVAGTVSASTAADDSRPRTTAAAGTAAAPVASVEGSARIHFTLRPDDTIRFQVKAKGAPYSEPRPGVPTGLPTDARGTIRYSHRIAGTEKVGWAVAEVDCLSTGGKTATVTAVIRKTNVERIGKRIGISFQQGEGGAPSRLGFSWGVVNVDGGTDGAGEPGGTGTCQAPAPFAPATEGGYRVRHAEVAPLPTAGTRP